MTAQLKRDIFLLEIERRRTIRQALQNARWTASAYWSHRHRHREWAEAVDYAVNRAWWSARYGQGTPLDGRAIRGVLQRRDFLECINEGMNTSAARRAVGWTGPAYWQARYRHRDWAQHVDQLTRTA
jgi:hypothetical protein